MQKKKLMNNLKNDIYCRLGVSSIQGVGVIAIRDIPINTNPFKIAGKKYPDYHIIEISKEDIKPLPLPVRNLLTDFIAPSDNGKYAIPCEGLNMMDISF